MSYRNPAYVRSYERWLLREIILLLGAACVIIFVFSLMALLDEEYVIVLLGALAIAVVIFGISAVAKGAETTTYHRAIIYDMDSFDHGRYEITEVEGRIFTIIDKEAGRE